ncbi:sensor domain-containing diguanylate cyclase [Methylophaga pinxianii]|uniref:sensor domain-containing diguanylate cyclase n=1 Tax=Methylophaga pinxianii TaxID=2881052 RepID=UPI001CF1B90A|nr:PAS domain S-box protein [Methylophaga pinxianii]MCB2426999.1 PAS domain S-box protein [Methylophaga pinxianii]UPH46955.1 PAS domain S-box protein [Methylophaga pinxianii]
MELVIRTNQSLLLKPFTLVTSFFAFMFGLIVTFFIAGKIAEMEHVRLEAAYTLAFNETVDAVIGKINAYEEMLRATQGLFYVAPDLSRNDFANFYQSLRLEENYPGIQGLGYVVALTPEQKQSHIDAVRQSGLLTYDVHPEGERKYYSSNLYIEPLTEKNMRALGFDMYSDTNRREAMDRAVSSGQATLTEKVLLKQDGSTDSINGMVMYLPVLIDPSETELAISQRKINTGWVYAVFRLDDVLKDVLAIHKNVGLLDIYDDNADKSESLLFTQTGEASDVSFSLQKSYEVGGRTWSFVGQPDKQFVNNMSRNNPLFTWLIGTVISLLFALVIAAIAKSRANAIRIASQMTKSYRQNARRLALATEAAEIAIWEWDIETNIIMLDSMASMVFGVKPGTERLEYSEFEKLIHEADLLAFRVAVEQAMQQHKAIEIRFRIYHGSEIKMLHTSAELYFNEAGQILSLVGVSYDITEDWQHQKTILETEQRWKHALEGSGAGVWDWDVTNNVVVLSDKLLLILGYLPGEIKGQMENWLKLVHPQDIERVTADINQMLSGEKPEYRNEHRILSKDGSWKWMLGSASVGERDAQNNALRVIGTKIDISWRKQAELALQQSEERFRNAFDTAAIGMAIVGLDGRWLEVNSALCRMLGYSEEELLDKTFVDVTHPDDLDLDLDYLRKLLNGDLEHYQMEKRYFHKTGDVIFVLLSVSVVRNERGEVIHFISQIEDVTARKSESDRIRQMAYHDTLTGLPNRRLFDERIGHTLAHAKRVGYPIALMFVDVDHFKQINDTHGHDVGDEILKSVADRMAQCLRQTDTLSRVGGDEFVILLTEVKKPGDAKGVAEHILETVSQPLHIHTHNFRITLSIGVAIFNGDIETETVAELTKKADLALYEVKSAGRNGVHVFGSNHLNAESNFS